MNRLHEKLLKLSLPQRNINVDGDADETELQSNGPPFKPKKRALKNEYRVTLRLNGNRIRCRRLSVC